MILRSGTAWRKPNRMTEGRAKPLLPKSASPLAIVSSKPATHW